MVFLQILNNFDRIHLEMVLTAIVLIIFGFLLGSIPFSILLGRLFRHTDIRTYGDGNPGAANAFKAGGWKTGVPALLLDFLKGAVPVYLAGNHFQISGAWMIPIAIAPIAGHAYSPFLHFKGGKAITTTFGVWAGLTLYQAPLLLGLFCATFYMLLESSAWASMLSFLGFFVIFQLFHFDTHLLLIGALNLVILLHKHYPELRLPISLRKR